MISSINNGAFGAKDVSQMWQKLLKRTDKSGDGKLSTEELSPVAQPSDENKMAAVEEFLKRLDTDTDGSVSELEFTSGVQEMRPPGPRPMAPEKIFKRADTDGDGRITKDELKTAISQGGQAADDKVDALFAKLDGDAEGAVTESEFVDGIKKLHEERKAAFSPAQSWESPHNLRKLIEQVSKNEGYDSGGETRKTLPQSLFSARA